MSEGKVSSLDLHDNLLINRKMLEHYREEWTEVQIDGRTEALAELLCLIWPVPEGHSVPLVETKASTRSRINLVDIIGAGLLARGHYSFTPDKESTQCVSQLSFMPTGP